MKVHLECVQCTLRQAWEGAVLATADPNVRRAIVLKSLEALAEYDSYATPAELGGAVHELIKAYSGNEDPYQNVKEDSIRIAHGIYPALKLYAEAQDDTLLAALEASAVGNLLDAGVYGDLRAVDLEAVLREEMTKGLACCDVDAFREELSRADTVVVIGDNAGETVLDRILVSEIKSAAGQGVRVFYGVRSAPMINDATAEDALASGLDHDATIVSTGSAAPGLVLREAAPDFLKLYRQADVVVSKGQGNYETLSDFAGRAIYFLLKAKCEPVAADIGVSTGDYAFIRRCAHGNCLSG